MLIVFGSLELKRGVAEWLDWILRQCDREASSPGLGRPQGVPIDHVQNPRIRSIIMSPPWRIPSGVPP